MQLLVPGMFVGHVMYNPIFFFFPFLFISFGLVSMGKWKSVGGSVTELK